MLDEFSFLKEHSNLLDASTLTLSMLADGLIVPLTDRGIIAADGEQSIDFLQSQFTGDIRQLASSPTFPNSGQATFTAYCTPKGRVLATFWVWRALAQDREHLPSALYLQLPRSILENFQQRLKIFILRSKVQLTNVSERRLAFGLIGQSVQALQRYFPELPVNPGEILFNAAGYLLRVPDAFAQPRYQWLTSTDFAQQAWSDLTRQYRVAQVDVWNLTEIHAGMPHLAPATQDKFIPQMINLDLIGGVNFKKGCYPGQEIVARTHYLGKVKRRMALMHAEHTEASAISAGLEVFSANDPTQPCGAIVNATRSLGNQGHDCLVELKLEAWDSAIYLQLMENRHALQHLPLPYALNP